MKFVIITPAFNEEKNIGRTIESVLKQSLKPHLWVIVDDGSIDSTSDIIQQYASQHSWIKYIYRAKEPGQSYYASNVYAIIAGLNTFRLQDYDYLAILDADIELPANYYEEIMKYFADNPKLGIASGHCLDRVGDKLKKGLYDWRSAPKNIMVFRRQCYEEIGGFIPLKYAGEDTVACFMARMKGWDTWATMDLMVIHNKPLGTGITKNILKIRFNQGVADYFLAAPAAFMFLKCLKRSFVEPPFLISGITRFLGFLLAPMKNEKRQLPDDLIKFIRSEQLSRIYNFTALKKNRPLG